MAAEEVRAVTARAFSDYSFPLDMVPYFKYLGIVLPVADDDWSAVIHNLAKAQTVWQRMSRILSREGGILWVSVFFFKAIVQSVLLFDAETWVVNSCIVRVLGGFQYQVARRLTGRLPRRRLDVRWEYTLVEVAREEAFFGPMETYIRQRNHTFAQYIATRLILYL